MSYETYPMDGVTFHGEKDGMPTSVEWNGDSYEVPDLEQLEEWTTDSVCESLMGECVEPDGFDGQGYPSWLMALGLV